VRGVRLSDVDARGAWRGVRFGGNVNEGEKLGVAKAMCPSLDETYKRPPVVVEKLLEDFKVRPVT
jgi:hypothetical protein